MSASAFLVHELSDSFSLFKLFCFDSTFHLAMILIIKIIKVTHIHSHTHTHQHALNQMLERNSTKNKIKVAQVISDFCYHYSEIIVKFPVQVDSVLTKFQKV
jgi:hypothetical protein